MSLLSYRLSTTGAGKGTQCEYLLENYPCVHLSAGQLLREEAQKTDTSPHAALIEECLVEGKIVPVEISLSLLQNAMREANGKSLIFLIDGFPRNFDNLEGWTRCMTGVADVWGVLYYQCPLSILEKRVMERSKDSGRSDDNLDSLRRRFNTFEGETVPVINTLRRVQNEHGSLLKVVDIAGEQSREQVWEDTQKTMNDFLTNDILSANAQLLRAIAMSDVDTYQSLCADELFDISSTTSTSDDHVSSSSTPIPSPELVLDVMRTQEGKEEQFDSINVKCAELTFLTGTKVSVSYDRTSTDGVTFRETRIWSHQGPKGWRMVYFFRSPSS
jgi:UMP-CMP kinase